MNKNEIKNKLDLHKKWLNGEEGGAKLDLSYADLSYADLSYADLSYADLSYTNLSYADLSYTNLSYANLYEVNLSCANLYEVNLRRANLSCADLNNVDLSKAKFYLTTLYKIKGDFVNVGNIGSRNDTTHYFYNDNRIICGCFDGTMEEFEDKVKETYEENSKEYKQYIIAIDTLKKLAELGGKEK